MGILVDLRRQPDRLPDLIGAVGAIDSTRHPQLGWAELHIRDDLLRVGQRKLAAHHLADHAAAAGAAADAHRRPEQQREECGGSDAQAACATGWKLRGNPALATAPYSVTSGNARAMISRVRASLSRSMPVSTPIDSNRNTVSSRTMLPVAPGA